MGRHELKAGVTFDRQFQGDGAVAGRHGNYQLIVDTISGVPRQPFQFRTYNYPVLAEQRLNEGGAFAQDTWAVTDRLTLNLGFRFDTFHSWLPPQTKEPSQFGTSGSFAEREVGSWHLPAPRLGAIFQLTGDGKTVVKATYGRYNHTPGDDFAQAYNPNSGIITTYRWRDLNGNGDYDPGEVNLDTNGPDFVSITGQVSSGSASSVGAVNILDNPDLVMPRTQQATLSLERELFANFGARFGYYYVRQQDLIETINARRPVLGLQRAALAAGPGSRWPGEHARRRRASPPSGITTPAYRGSNFVASQRVNRPDGRDQWSHTIEAVLTRRTTAKWGMMGTVAFEKNHRWLVGVVQSPNDEYFPVDDHLVLARQAHRQLPVAVGVEPVRHVPGLQRHPIAANVSVPRSSLVGHGHDQARAVRVDCRHAAIPPESPRRQGCVAGGRQAATAEPGRPQHSERRVAVGIDQRVRRDLRLLHVGRFAANSAIWRALLVLTSSRVCDCKRKLVVDTGGSA